MSDTSTEVQAPAPLALSTETVAAERVVTSRVPTDIRRVFGKIAYENEKATPFFRLPYDAASDEAKKVLGHLRKLAKEIDRPLIAGVDKVTGDAVWQVGEKVAPASASATKK